MPEKELAGAARAHHHNEEHRRAIVHRMSRAIGHFAAVKKMVEDDADCSEILIQLSAVRSAVNNIGKEILKEHLTHCIVDAVETGDRAPMDALGTAIDRFIK